MNLTVTVIRKPFTGTVARNVVKWGTGGINIDGTRIPGENPSISRRQGSVRHLDGGPGSAARHYAEGRIVSRQSAESFSTPKPGELLGRYPANLILDEVAASMLDDQSGELTSGSGVKKKASGSAGGIFDINKVDIKYCGGSTGGASRFFYCTSSRLERDNRDKGDK